MKSTFVENEKDIISQWDVNFGDRINELVFIDFGVDKNQMKKNWIIVLVQTKNICFTRTM